VRVLSVDKLITKARRLAKEYRDATGKTLPITGEIAINDAIRLLKIESSASNESSYDAVFLYKGERLHVQIKDRAVVNPKRAEHRLGQLKLDQNWQAIVLVIMNVHFETSEIYIAERNVIAEVLGENKNRRGSINVARFKIIGELLWSAKDRIENDGYWSNAD
jgi:hypothetical protein